MKKLMGAVSVVVVALSLGACASKVELDKSKGAPVENATPTTGADGRAVAPVTATGTDPLNDPKGVLAKRSIFFDFDSYEIKQDFRGVVEAHSKYLRDTKSKKVFLEGNTDERGTREYNLALGQKRAEAVRRAMSALGVADSQIDAVSFGKEKPRAMGHDEAAWAENRRVDIRY